MFQKTFSVLVVFFMLSVKTVFAQDPDLQNKQEVVETPYTGQVDSLLLLQHELGTFSEETLKSVKKLAYAMTDDGYHSQTETFILHFIEVAKNEGNKNHEALLYHVLGYNYKRAGNNLKALASYQKSIALRQETDDEYGMPPTYNNMGNIYYDLGQYAKSMEVLKKSINILQETGREEEMANELAAVGSVLSDQKRYEEAFDYYKQSLRIASSNQDSLQMCHSNISIGIVHFSIKQYDSALHYLENAFKLGKAIDYPYSLGYVQSNMGTVYIETKAYKKAEDHLLESLRVREQVKSPLEIALSQLELARLYHLTNQTEKSVIYAEKALENSINSGYLEGEQQAHEHLSKAYETLGNPQTSLNHYKAYKKLSDSLLSIDERNKVNATNTQIQIERETHDLKLQQARERNKFITVLALLAILAIALTAWLIYRLKTRKKKAEMALRQQELEAEQSILLSLQNERSRISRDIYDDLGTSLSGLRIYSEMLAQKAQSEDHKHLLEITQDIIQKARDIAWSLNAENNTLENLSWYCQSYAEKLLDKFPIKLESRIGNLPEMNLNGQVRKNVFLCTKEALNNLLKYADASKVSFAISYANGTYKAEISDNGKGIDPLKKNRWGNGLENMKNRMEAIGGNFIIDSTQKGTRVVFTLRV